MSPAEGIVIVAVLLAVVLTLLWMVVHGLWLFRIGGQLSEVSKQAQLAWLLSLVGGFMGPCVVPMSVVGMILAVMARRADEVNEPTLQATRAILQAGAIILVMMLVLLASVGLSTLVHG